MKVNSTIAFLFPSLSSSSKMRETKNAKDFKTNKLGNITINRLINVAKFETKVRIALDAIAINSMAHPDVDDMNSLFDNKKRTQ